MEPGKKEKGESLWQQMLESMLTQKTEKVGNLLWCGPSKSGKKKLINSIQELTKQSRAKTKEEPVKNADKAYMMDFKYVKVNKRINDYAEEQSKLNFHIINKQHEYIKEFLTTDMLSNLVVVVIADLEDPQLLREGLDEWVTFLTGCIKEFVNGLGEDRRKAVLRNLRDVKAKLRSLSDFSSLQNYHYETGPISVQGQIDDPEVEAHEEELELEIPLIIIGNKCDVLDRFNDERMFEYLQFVLRQTAIKYGAIALTTSGQAERNIQLLYRIIGSALVDLKEEDTSIFEPSNNITKMFVPIGVDDMQLVNSQLQSADSYVFKQKVVNKQDVKKGEKSDIKDINEFLGEINRGQFAFQANLEGANARVENGGFAMARNTSRVMNESGSSVLNRSSRLLDESNPATKSKFDKIRGILNN